MAVMLTIVWSAAAIAGVTCALGGWLLPAGRRTLLSFAGVSFFVAGVLGILTIGILFLALGAVCFVAATRNETVEVPPVGPREAP